MPKSKPREKRRSRRPSFNGSHVLVCGKQLPQGMVCLLPSTTNQPHDVHVTIAIDDLDQVCVGYLNPNPDHNETSRLLWQVVQESPAEQQSSP